MINAQTDSVFWIAPPEVTMGSNQLDRPVLLWISSLLEPTQVTISQPSNTHFIPILITLQPNTIQSVDLTDQINFLETYPPNTVKNSG